MPRPKHKPKSKHPKKHNGGPSKKHRQPKPPNAPVKVTTITDVNDNCLEHIFKHLTVSDLLNVSDSSKFLKNAARLAFISKYGKHAVRLEFMTTYPPEYNDRIISIHDLRIKILDFPTCLKMLRCFGASITKLTTFILCERVELVRECDELGRYLGEYCAESVVELDYKGATLKHLKKPLTKVETVRFSHTEFRCEPAEMNRCFPNLRELTLKRVRTIEPVTGLLPKLDNLDIFVPEQQHENFEMCLRSNPQLRSLRISGYSVNAKFLRILSKNSQLETLYLEDSKHIALTPFDFDPSPIIIMNVKKLEIGGSYLKWLDAANVSIAFDQLDELTINGWLDGNVVRFVSKHPFISKFKLKKSSRESNKDKLFRLAEALLLVTELRLMQVLSADDVFNFISECHLLKYFEFSIKSREEYDAMRGSLGTEWRSFIPTNTS